MKKRITGLLILMLLCTTFLLNPSQEAQAAPEPEVVDNNAIRVMEVLELRDSRSKTYKLSDGSYEWVGYAQDVHYRDPKGKYQEIDNSIVAENLKTKGADYRYKNKANSFTVRFGDIADTSASPVYIEYEGKSIAFAPANGKASFAEKTKNAKGKMLEEVVSDTESCILYKDVYPGIDLMYEAITSGIKEYIILNQPSDTNTFEFDLKLDELKVKEEDGSILFVDNGGNSIFSIGNLFAVDDSGVMTQDIKCTVAMKNGLHKLSLTVDEEYLSDKSRVYPIVIDPSIMITGGAVTYDSYVSSKLPTGKFYLENYLRTGSDEPYGARRTYIKFTLPTNIPCGNVVSAYLRLEKRDGGANPVIRAYRVKSDWSSNTIDWNNKPNYDDTNYYSLYAYNDSGSWWRMTCTSLVTKWLKGVYNNYGFLVRDNTESGTSQWTTFYSSEKSSPHKPELHIIYVPYDTTLMALNENGINRNAYFSSVTSYVLNNRQGNVYSAFYVSISVSNMKTRLQSTLIFFIHTHGSRNGFNIGPDTSITSSDLSGTNLDNLKCALLLTCNTGAGGYSSTRVANNNPTNIVERMIICGSKTVIGFSDITYVSDCNKFAERFAQRTMSYGYTVYNAINNMDCSDFISDMSTIAVIGGNSSLTLKD